MVVVPVLIFTEESIAGAVNTAYNDEYFVIIDLVDYFNLSQSNISTRTEQSLLEDLRIARRFKQCKYAALGFIIGT